MINRVINWRVWDSLGFLGPVLSILGTGIWYCIAFLFLLLALFPGRFGWS